MQHFKPIQLVIAALMLAALFCVGCGKQERSPLRLVGRWSGRAVINEHAVDELFDEAGADPAKHHLTEDIVKRVRSIHISTEFAGDGKLHQSGSLGEIHGTWEIVSQSGDMTTVRTIGDDDIAQEMTLTFEGDDTFIISPPAELAEIGHLRFQRMQR